MTDDIYQQPFLDYDAFILSKFQDIKLNQSMRQLTISSHQFSGEIKVFLVPSLRQLLSSLQLLLIIHSFTNLKILNLAPISLFLQPSSHTSHCHFRQFKTLLMIMSISHK